MQRPQLRTPFQRAVVPVAAGILFFVVLGLFLWGVAAYISGNSDEVSLAPTTFDVGRTESMAETIAEQGPLILPDLLRASGRRTIVLDHAGDDPQQGWHVYMAYPADRDVDCKIEQVRHTREFIDCEGRTVVPEDLALPPEGVGPIVSADGNLTLDLLPAGAEPTQTTAAA